MTTADVAVIAYEQAAARFDVKRHEAIARGQPLHARRFARLARHARLAAVRNTYGDGPDKWERTP